MQNVFKVARLHCWKSVHWPKKFDLVHQTISLHERVGSGDKTNGNLGCGLGMRQQLQY